MKKIIDGKVYDTLTAEQVGDWWNKETSFARCYEALYRKRTGEFFLYGEGGPRSKYAISCGDNEWSGSEKIIPLSYEAAQKWAEEHLDGEEYEKIFGEVVDDDTRAYITLSLSKSAVEQAKRNASKNGLSLSAYIESLISQKTQKAEA